MNMCAQRTRDSSHSDKWLIIINYYCYYYNFISSFTFAQNVIQYLWKSNNL